MTYTPPQSLEAEAAVLGAAMLSRAAAATAVDALTSGDFIRHAHQEVFAAIVEATRSGRGADVVTITEALARVDRLDEVGGPAALHDLTADVGPPSHVERWTAIVADKARRRATIEAARSLAAAAVDGDLDEAIEAGIGALTSRRGTEGVVDKDQVAADFIHRLGEGDINPAWPSGWLSLDRLWRLPQRALTVVTGLPAHGKSTFLDVLVHRLLARNDGLRVAFFSPEQGPPADHLHELVTTRLGIDPAKADGADVHDAMQWWLDRVDWIDDSRENTPAAVLAQARKLAPDVLIVDPYNNLAADAGSRFDRQDLYIADLLRRFRRYARETGCAVVIVAHPRQTETIKNTDAVFRVPTAAHISGGQEWWNHSDTILTVWRNHSGEEPHNFGPPEDTKVVVQKVRRRQWGRPGAAVLRFDEDERRYHDRTPL